MLNGSIDTMSKTREVRDDRTQVLTHHCLTPIEDSRHRSSIIIWLESNATGVQLSFIPWLQDLLGLTIACFLFDIIHINKALSQNSMWIHIPCNHRQLIYVRDIWSCVGYDSCNLWLSDFYFNFGCYIFGQQKEKLVLRSGTKIVDRMRSVFRFIKPDKRNSSSTNL